MFNLVKLELMSQEDLDHSKSKRGIYNCHIHMKRMEFATWCIVDLYRIVLYPQELLRGNKNMMSAGPV